MLNTDNPGKLSRWLTLAADVHFGLAAAADESVDNTIGSANWAREAVAVRLLLRSCRNLEGFILLCEGRLVVESRTLARNLIENSFGVAALESESTAQKYLKMLKDDSEESRRRQGLFILDKLRDTPGDLTRLKEVMEAMDNNLKLMGAKQVAQLGNMLPQYLGYQRLSDDSAHPTANALQHHVAVHRDGDRKHWTYRFELGTDEELSATTHYALLAAIAVGIGVTHLVKAYTANAAMHELAERFRCMPPVATI